MSDLLVKLTLPAGGTQDIEIPDDVPVGELMPELITALSLPTVGPDGRHLGYRMDSKRLGRKIEETETLSQAGVQSEDRLVLATEITAG